MLIVVTRLQGKGVAATATVGRWSGEVLAQLAARPGFLGGRLLIDRRCAAWTLTAWSDRASLDGFRKEHAPVAARLGEVAVDSASTAWTADDVPSWREVGRRWTSVVPPGAGLRKTVPPSGVATPRPASPAAAG